MRQSQLFTKTRKDSPKDEVSRNADLLIRAGFIHKDMAGVYTLLPLGLRVVKKIQQIIREEMNAIGGQQMLLTALQDKDVWEKTGRWDDDTVDNWFKTKLKNDTEVGLAFTHEEPLASLMKNHISSYRDLPAYPYQFQTKFRNEERAKSGILRTREFLMKDLYSFSRNQEQHDGFYETVKQAYINIFKKIGIGECTYLTFASGGSFAKYSHEFQTLTEAGEDTIYVSSEKGIAVNKEVLDDEVLNQIGVKRDELEEKTAVEVGNIFSLGTKYSEALELLFKDEDGETKPVIMGSYGIGLGRLMGVIAEVLSDENGLVWPESVAPYKVHLVKVGTDERVSEEADQLYEEFKKKGVEVLYDDRDIRPGEKFADAELIGLPCRVVVSEKTLEKKGYEIKDRTSEETNIISKKELIDRLATE